MGFSTLLAINLPLNSKLEHELDSAARALKTQRKWGTWLMWVAAASLISFAVHWLQPVLQGDAAARVSLLDKYYPLFTAENPLGFDSRLFLLPLPVLLHWALQPLAELLPGFEIDFIVALLAAAGAAAIIFRMAWDESLGLLPAALFAMAFSLNPYILAAVVQSSPLLLCLLLYAALFFFLLKWAVSRGWLQLVALGLTGLLLVTIRFDMLILFFFPLLWLALSALMEKPGQPLYAENAMWIAATPPLYGLLSRFLFSGMLLGDPLAYLAFEQPLIAPIHALPAPVMMADMSFGPGLVFWQINALFPFLVPALLFFLLVSAFLLRADRLLVLAFALLPLVLSVSASRRIITADLLLIIPAGIFLLLLALAGLKKGRNFLAWLWALLLLSADMALIFYLLS